MSIAAPPRPPRFDTSHELGALEALIEEARRRARRRRQAYGACAFVLAALGVGAYFGSGHGGGSTPPPAAVGGTGGESGFGQGGNAADASPKSAPPATGRRIAAATPLVSGALLSGTLTIIGLPHETASGWYDMSIIGNRGRLQPFLHCPRNDPDTCGAIEALDWSPDGRRLAFAVTSIQGTRAEGLHVFNLETGSDRELAENCWFHRGLAWSPDGTKIAYACSSFGAGGSGQKGGIYVIGLHGRPRLLKTGTRAYDTWPSWSPDGKHLAFATEQRGHTWVSVVDLDGTGRRRVADHAGTPAWSPDGRVIAVRRSSCHGIKLVTPQGRDATPLPRGPVACPGIGVRGIPSWSPSGDQIAIGAYSGTYVVNADGTHLGLVTRTNGRGQFLHGGPAWRPTGIG